MTRLTASAAGGEDCVRRCEYFQNGSDAFVASPQKCRSFNQKEPSLSLLLTEETIRAVMGSIEEGQRQDLLDPQTPGLQLRVTSTGAHWSLRIYVQGSTRVRLPLGAWPALSIENARASALAVKSQMTGEETEASGSLTLGALLAQYDRRRLGQLRRGVGVKRALARGFAGLRHREISTIGRRDIVAAIDAVAETAPVQANRTLAYAKAFFSWAVGRGYLDRHPAAGIPKVVNETSRDRTPTLGEVAEIWLACDAIGYPFGPAIQLLILTAVRRDEGGALRLSELDLPPGEQEGCWTIPAARSKNGRAIRVPLSAAARRVIEAAARQRSVVGPYLFTTTGRTAASGWARAKRRLDDRIAEARLARQALGEMPPWRLHDLRRAFATAASDILHVDPAVADRCLNHVGSSTTSTIARVYGRNEMFDQRQDALRKWAELVEAAVDTLRRTTAEQVADREAEGEGFGCREPASEFEAAPRKSISGGVWNFTEIRGSWGNDFPIEPKFPEIPALMAA
jgi:integrase